MKDPQCTRVNSSYCTPKRCTTQPGVCTKWVPHLNLCSLSQIGKVPYIDDGDFCYDDEEMKFNAETHMQFFTENVSIFDREFPKWYFVLIADNHITHLWGTTIVGKSYPRRCSHIPGVEINWMVSINASLTNPIDSMHGTLLAARKGNIAGIMHIISKLKPAMHNATKYSGEIHMHRWFKQIRAEFIDAGTSVDDVISIEIRNRRLVTKGKSRNMLAEIGVFTESSQTRGIN